MATTFHIAANVPHDGTPLRKGDEAARTTSIYRIQVLDRVFSILDALAASESGMALSELTRGVGLHKSTLHRLLAVLEGRHYVQRNGRNGRFVLGPKLLELGSKVVAKVDMVERARPILDRLVTETGETAHLGVLRQGDIVSIAHAESTRTLRTPATVGKRTPAHCTSIGKAILAFSRDTEVDQFIRSYGLRAFTRNTITDPDGFRAILRRARDDGFAFDNEEFEEGLRCVGAPVRDHTGQVVAALSITGPASRLVTTGISFLSAAVVRAAADLSSTLSFRGSGSRDSVRANGSSSLEERFPA
ncbi:MAG: IclR family transcriptional regulator [Vicinamibacteraceae bacterium]